MADLATPAGTPANPYLTPDVRALLAAVRAAIDLPMPGLDVEDERDHRQLLIDRAGVARIILDCVLDRGHDIPTATAWLTDRTADSPVTYTVWTPRDTEGGRS